MAEKKKKPATAKKNGAVSTKKASRPGVTKKAAKKKTVKKTVSKPAAAKKTLSTRKTGKKPPYKKPKKDEECFLTTACVNYYGLADDSYELKTLRSFRDTYMAIKTKGKALIKHYYNIAPTLVALINKDKEHKTVYQSVFTVIQKACTEIEQKRFAKAQNTYVSLVRGLQERYKQ